MLCFDDFILFLFRIGTIVEVHSGPLAAQTEDLETISTGEVKNSSVDLVEGALTLTGIKSIKIVVVNQKLSFTQGKNQFCQKLNFFKSNNFLYFYFI